MNLIVFSYGLAAEILQIKDQIVVYCLPVQYSLVAFFTNLLKDTNIRLFGVVAHRTIKLNSIALFTNIYSMKEPLK